MDIGRAAGIRTLDLVVPNDARYQTALQPVIGKTMLFPKYEATGKKKFSFLKAEDGSTLRDKLGKLLA